MIGIKGHHSRCMKRLPVCSPRFDFVLMVPLVRDAFWTLDPRIGWYREGEEHDAGQLFSHPSCSTPPTSHLQSNLQLYSFITLQWEAMSSRKMLHSGFQRTSSTNLASSGLSHRQHDGKFGIVTGGSRGKQSTFISSDSGSPDQADRNRRRHFPEPRCERLLTPAGV